jgi:hypothetical protein
MPAPATITFAPLAVMIGSERYPDARAATQGRPSGQVGFPESPSDD